MRNIDIGCSGNSIWTNRHQSFGAAVEMPFGGRHRRASIAADRQTERYLAENEKRAAGVAREWAEANGYFVSLLYERA
jgi:hypothetical protein